MSFLPSLRRVVARVALVVSVLLPSASAHAGDIVISAVKSAFSLPLFVAEQKQLFAAEGVGVKLIECQASRRCLPRIFDGSAHLATASELPVVFNAFERDDYAIVATIATSNNNIRIVGRRSVGIVDAAGLAGKRVGVQGSSSSQYFLDLCLLYHGIDPERVVTVPVAGAAEAIEAFKRKEIDVYVGFSHHAIPALRSLGSDGVAIGAPRLYTESFNLIATRQLIETRPDELTRLLRAVARAESWIAERPAEAKRLLQARIAAEPGFVEAVFDHYNYRIGLEPSLVGTMERAARWALREGHVPAGRTMPNYLRFVAPGPLRAAVPGVQRD